MFNKKNKWKLRDESERFKKAEVEVTKKIIEELRGSGIENKLKRGFARHY